LTYAADQNGEPLATKLRLFAASLLVLSVSIVACLPILIYRPD